MKIDTRPVSNSQPEEARHWWFRCQPAVPVALATTGLSAPFSSSAFVWRITAVYPGNLPKHPAACEEFCCGGWPYVPERASVARKFTAREEHPVIGTPEKESRDSPEPLEDRQNTAKALQSAHSIRLFYLCLSPPQFSVSSAPTPFPLTTSPPSTS